MSTIVERARSAVKMGVRLYEDAPEAVAFARVVVALDAALPALTLAAEVALDTRVDPDALGMADTLRKMLDEVAT